MLHRLLSSTVSLLLTPRVVPSLESVIEACCLVGAVEPLKRADEGRRIVDGARSRVPRHSRVGAEGTRAGRHAARHPGGDDLVRRDALLDPLLERGQRVKRVGPPGGGAAAMPNIGQEEEAEEFLRLGLLAALLIASAPGWGSRSRRMPRESLDAPENLPEERRCQMAFGQLQDGRYN